MIRRPPLGKMRRYGYLPAAFRLDSPTHAIRLKRSQLYITHTCPLSPFLLPI